MSLPTALYKFVVANRVDVLENKLIRFTQPSALNDPFELKPLFETIIPEEEFEDTVTPPWAMIEEEVRKKYRTLTLKQREQIPSLEVIIEFLKANPEVMQNLLADFVPSLKQFASDFTPRMRQMIADALATRAGILSLSESLTNLLLWAHYAASHTGFAIAFNAQHYYFSRRRPEKDELYHLRKVRYVDRSSKGRALRHLDGDDLLVTKAASWEYEAEWRMLALLDDAERVIGDGDNAIYLFSFPIEAVSSVVLGARTPAWVRERVERIIASSDGAHIKLKRAVFDVDNQAVTISDAT